MQKKILVTGANGMLAGKLIPVLSQNHEVHACSKGILRQNIGKANYIELDLCDFERLADIVLELKPNCIIHTAAITQVDYCELNKDECFKVNVDSTKELLKLAEQVNSEFIYISSDFIFSGNDNKSLEETDMLEPLSFYGNTKLLAEEEVKQYAGKWNIVRTVLLYGVPIQSNRTNIFTWAIKKLRASQKIDVVNDQFRSPTFVDDLARAIEQIVEYPKSGVFHISGAEEMSVIDFVKTIANYFSLDENLIQPISSKSLNQPGVRPAKTVFNLSKAKEKLNFKPTPIAFALRCLEGEIESETE